MSIHFRRRLTASRPYNTAKNLDSSNDLSRLERALESDRGRIIQSAAIRRLQQKTQVFPLERNAAVRSRLTHSLEVQQTGRFIVRTIFDKLGPRAVDYGLDGGERVLETLVEMACLMHDIGNPPFGHFGEAAINQWFSNYLPTLSPFNRDDILSQALHKELCQFEGNAQALRLVHSLLKLNLTYVQTAGILKYTRPASEPKPDKAEPLSYLKKKPGFYESERPIVEQLQNHLDMPAGHRFFTSYLMEAADDISYCLADIEDGVEKGLLSYTQLADHLIHTFDGNDQAARHPFLGQDRSKTFADVVGYALKRADSEPVNPEHEFFVWLRVSLIHPLVNHAAQSFIDNIDGVYRGDLNRALLEDDSLTHHIISTFKTVAINHIFSVSEVETLELQGYRIISGLLDHYRPLLALSADEFTAVLNGHQRERLLESRLIKRLPRKHIRAYQQSMALMVGKNAEWPVWERYYRCRLIQDMVSGMTDQFALEEYQTLSVLD